MIKYWCGSSCVFGGVWSSTWRSNPCVTQWVPKLTQNMHEDLHTYLVWFSMIHSKLILNHVINKKSSAKSADLLLKVTLYCQICGSLHHLTLNQPGFTKFVHKFIRLCINWQNAPCLWLVIWTSNVEKELHVLSF